MDIECFMLTSTNRCRRWLRCYESAPCPLMPGEHSYHNACVLGEDCDLVRFDDSTITAIEFPSNDPRWPTKCACGYVFTGKKSRQTFFLEIYLTPDGKECTTHPQPPSGIQVAPAGAMWFSDCFSWKGPDGHTLTVMTPGGEWCIDGPASGSSSRPWTRTGIPPKVTVSPSIHIVGKYHGWLRDGMLSDC